MRTKAIRGVDLALVTFCLGLLAALPISETVIAGKVQEANDAVASNTKGLELFRSGKFEEAVSAYKQAIKLKQDYSISLLIQGNWKVSACQCKHRSKAWARKMACSNSRWICRP
jgi:hypothetical protein